MDMVSEAGDEREEDRESTAASDWNPGKVIKAQNTVINELQQRVDTLEQRNKQLVKENEQRTKMLETENRELNRKNKKLRKKLEGRRREFGGGDDEEESGNQVEVKEEPSDDAVSEDDDGETGNGRRDTPIAGTSGGRSLVGDKCRPCSVVLTRLSMEEVVKIRKSLVPKPTALKPKKTNVRKMSKVEKSKTDSSEGKIHRLVISKQWVKNHPRKKGYFMCSCGMDFRFKNTATSHIWRKNNSIPNFFKCTKCNKAYDHNFGLKRHYLLVHKLEYKWGKVVCEVCGLGAFDYLKELWKHRLEVHGLRRRNNI